MKEETKDECLQSTPAFAKLPVSSSADIDKDDYSDEDEFIPCSRCDGHDACADFGCAFKLGLGHMVDTDDW